jgi:uncharacterized tellurite resistance protein B-like protein
MSWTQLADELGTDAKLKALDADGIAAVLDVLALVVYADEKLGMLEQNEFEEQINALPFLAGKDPAGALAKAKAANSESAWRAILDASAATLAGQGLGTQVYRMAAEIAHADLQLHRNESTVLMAVVKAFGVDADTAAQIDQQVG